VNEEGLKFVEIRESLEDSEMNYEVKSGEAAQKRPPMKVASKIMNAEMGDFENELFKRMDALELEETEELEKGSDEEEDTENEEDDVSDLEKNHDQDSDEEQESEHSEEYEEHNQRRGSVSSNGSLSQKRVRFSDVVEEKEIPSRPPPTSSNLPNPSDSKQWIPIRDLVVEKELQEEEERESDVEEYQFGRQLALEYAKKKNRLENSNLIPKSRPGRDVEEVI
jgi:hypothetical protein